MAYIQRHIIINNIAKTRNPGKINILPPTTTFADNFVPKKTRDRGELMTGDDCLIFSIF
jgi:hypothetical protein